MRGRGEGERGRLATHGVVHSGQRGLGAVSRREMAPSPPPVDWVGEGRVVGGTLEGGGTTRGWWGYYARVVGGGAATTGRLVEESPPRARPLYREEKSNQPTMHHPPPPPPAGQQTDHLPLSSRCRYRPRCGDRPRRSGHPVVGRWRRRGGTAGSRRPREGGGGPSVRAPVPALLRVLSLRPLFNLAFLLPLF